jgi:hypothetical protein
MPLKFWDEVFQATVYLINRTPSKVIDHETPLEYLFKVKPNYLSLGQIFDHLTNTSFNFDPSNVLSLGIVIVIRDLSALIFQPVESTSLGM